MQEELFDQVYPRAARHELAQALGGEVPQVAPASFHARLSDFGAVEFIFSGWGCPLLDSKVHAAMPALRAIFHAAGTVRGIVTPDLWAGGVRVSSAAAANARPVADYTFAAMVFASKFVLQHADAARQRRRFAPPAPMGLHGAAVGLIGFSRVGQRVAEMLRPTGAHVLVFDPHLSPAAAEIQSVEKVLTLEELFSRCDIVSCHAPLLTETRGLVRGEHLRRLRPGGHFINTARGAVVAEAELVEVLRERMDLSATIDVTVMEPLPPDSPLRELTNVTLTPHLAGSQDRECSRLGSFALEEFARLQRGEPLQGEIHAASLAMIA